LTEQARRVAGFKGPPYRAEFGSGKEGGGGLSRAWQGEPDGFQFCGVCTAPLSGEGREQLKSGV